MARFRIHPAIGVARVGNSQDFFVGPEHPGIPANWDSASKSFKPFKDSKGRVLRQGALFRVFEFDASGNPTGEVTGNEGVSVTWHVHVANRKASFFAFNGQRGNETDPPYAARDRESPDAVEKEDRGRGQPGRTNRRNASVQDRRSLEIDPGEVSISRPGTVVLRDDQTASPIKQLGEITLQPDGRLLFVGGRGESASFDGAKPIDEYASNDGWFDDMSDGSVRAVVTLPGSEPEEADPAWVIVGPPDFAPGIGNVVSLYDTLWDIAVQHGLPCEPGGDPLLTDLVSQQRIWQHASNTFAPDYQPSFTKHIYPILSRAVAARDVHEPPDWRPSYHATVLDWSRLAKRDEHQIRQAVFRRVRNPAGPLDRENMPRGLGDDYRTLEKFENGESAESPSPQSFLSLTPVQYALLKAWAEGHFVEDWAFGGVRYAPIPAPGPITPHGLDAAALENCVGGPFYPGIEVSWLIRRPSLYERAFRLKAPGFPVGPLTFRAGFFSQQMALPWHADFYDCHKEDHTPDGGPEPLIYMWWTAQRPDDVRAVPDGPYRRWVAPFDEFKDSGASEADAVENLARFEQMRTRWSELSFIVLKDKTHLEQK